MFLWASRLNLHGGRGFLFEAREGTRARGADELSRLHRNSRRSVATPGLLNLERVWRLARGLTPLMRPSMIDRPPSRQPGPSGQWTRFAGQEKLHANSDGWKALTSGCRSITTIDIDIAPGRLEITIALVNTGIGIWDYVMGIRLVGEHGHEHIAGRIFNDHDVVCNVQACHGFRVAMGPGGLSTLQVVGPGLQSSEWVGSMEGMPQSECLKMERPVTGLRIPLDAGDHAQCV